MTTKFLKQGEFVAPELQHSGATAPAKADSEAANGIVACFSKTTRASDTPSATNCMNGIFREAISFSDAPSSAQSRGIGLMTFIFLAALTGWGVPSMTLNVIEEIKHGFFDFFSLMIYPVLYFVLWRFGVAMLPTLWRMDMFAADSQPTIFDRKHRKVYRLFSPLDGSDRKSAWRGKPLELHAAEYDWNCITAEHRVELITRGNSVARIHRLVMVARDYPKPGEQHGRVLEEFEIGNALVLGETSVPMLWEHIRRYMEDKGPPLPSHEVLQVFERPRNLWQSMGVVSPFGPRFGWWWKHNRFATVFALMSSPFSLPFSLLWSVCNWISHKSMRKTIWPNEVHARIGEPVQVAH